jgi:hypothetical protein
MGRTIVGQQKERQLRVCNSAHATGSLDLTQIHGYEDFAVSDFVPKKENPAAGTDGVFALSDGRGSGGLGGRPSPLVTRHPDQVQSGSPQRLNSGLASLGLPQSRAMGVLGGHLSAPETINLLGGHLLYGLLVGAIPLFSATLLPL